MSKGEIQYIADSDLIEKIAQLSEVDAILYKEAGLVSDLFSGAGTIVSNFVKQNVDTSTTGAFMKSILNLLAPGMFFKVHPMLGILYSIGSMFGFDASSILTSIINTIKPKILAGERVTPEEVNQAGIAASGGNVSFASSDLLLDLRELEKTGSIMKAAQSYSGKGQPIGGSFLGNKGAPLLLRLFGFLGQKRRGAGKSLAAGFIVWFIKTVLLSAGLLMVGGAAKSFLSDDKKKDLEGFDVQQDSNVIPTSNNGSWFSEQQTQQIQQVQPQSVKYVPIHGTPANTLVEWAIKFYPNLSGYEDIIMNTPAFKNAVSILSKDYEKGKLAPLPPGITEKQLVDSFAYTALAEVKRSGIKA